MKRFAELGALWALTLWVGGLWAIGYLAAPILFYELTDQLLAGQLAGKLFSGIAYVGMVCGGYLAVFRLTRHGATALKQPFFWIVLTMLVMTLGQHFGIQPVLQQLKDYAGPQDVMQSLFRDRFRTWHGVSSVIYLMQSLLGLLLVTKQASR